MWEKRRKKLWNWPEKHSARSSYYWLEIYEICENIISSFWMLPSLDVVEKFVCYHFLFCWKFNTLKSVRRAIKTLVVYMCFIFESMHSIFALPGWRHRCILKKEGVSHFGLIMTSLDSVLAGGAKYLKSRVILLPGRAKMLCMLSKMIYMYTTTF